MTDIQREAASPGGQLADDDDVIDGYRRLYSPIVSDVLDGLGHRGCVMEPGLRPVGSDGAIPMVGWAYPVRFGLAEEGSTIDAVLDMVDSIPAGSVVVVAQDQEVGSALWGGLCSAGAVNRGCRGVIVDGAVRDYRQLVDMALPVYAARWSPRDVRDRGRLISRGEPVTCRDVAVRARDLVMADVNGVVVVPAELVTRVLELGLERVEREQGAWATLKEGVSAGDVYRQHHVF